MSNGAFINGGVGGNGVNGFSFEFQISAVPEPETYAMLMAGLGLLGFIARRRQARPAMA